MKPRLFLPVLLFFCVSALFASGKSDSSLSKERSREVTVYAYDSFVAEWGPAPEMAKRFEEQTGYRVSFVSCGDAAQVLSRLVLEKSRPQADVAVGIDNQLYATAAAQNVFEPYKPKNADSAVPAELRFGSNWLLTPYDWSYFAMIWDSASSVPAPQSLADLTKDIYRRKIILMDPRTSTPGLGFITWTAAVFGKGSKPASSEPFVEYWRALKPNILTMAPGWDAGYGLFQEGEAPLVISYTTSPAYHVEYDETDRYKALIFPEGHTVQIEGAGLVMNAPNKDGAKAFLDFLISESAQDVIPMTQWMYPVNEQVELPGSYRAAPKAGKILSIDTSAVSDCIDSVMAILAE